VVHSFYGSIVYSDGHATDEILHHLLWKLKRVPTRLLAAILHAPGVCYFTENGGLVMVLQECVEYNSLMSSPISTQQVCLATGIGGARSIYKGIVCSWPVQSSLAGLQFSCQCIVHMHV
jgi:hypothetical protein